LTDGEAGTLGGSGRVMTNGAPSRVVFYLGQPRSISAIRVFTGNIDARGNQDFEIRLANNAANPGQQPKFPEAPTFTSGDKVVGGNGGGYMNILSGISSYFCKTATDSDPLVASAKYKDGTEYGFYATRNLYHEYFSADSRIYLLADADSASASECLIGCMIDYGALQPTDICLVEKDGTAKTYGKGIMQTTYTFGLGVTDAIRLTTAQIEWPLSSRCIHGVGLTGADGCKSTPYVFDHDGEIYGGLTALGITV
jgi:hypothetical protein